METAELVVIGAGIYGLAAAKAYLDVNPDAKIVVLEAASAVGGVWASHRLYPGLKSNNMLGTYEYSDFPMTTEEFGVQPGQHIPGHVMHRYLTAYAKRFDVYPNIRFDTKVSTVERMGEKGWALTYESGESEYHLMAEKLVVATGMTSQAFLPEFVGAENFDTPLFHSKDFLQHADTLETSSSVVVFGGTKSAWDAVYAYATKGIKVNWVIRESGHGPCWMAPPYVTPLKIWLEKLLHTRFLTFFSPCIWGSADGYHGIRNFFHGTFLGRMVVNSFWAILGGDVKSLNRYNEHSETKKLTPWSNPFFLASGLSILNYETDFFDLVRNGQVKVHISDIANLSSKTVNLSNGSSLPADALICSTGWHHTPPFKFLPTGLEAELGLPHLSSSFPTTLIEEADKQILNTFPRLRDQPAPNPKAKSLSTKPSEESLQPYRLHRFIAPLSTLTQHNIAFAGSLMSLSTTMIAQTQALWITAYFGNMLRAQPSPSAETTYETVLHSRFGRWRYPEGFGARFPDFAFDALPYVDLLLSDLGLNRWRKGGVKEVIEAYGPEDYRGLVGEFLRGVKGQNELDEVIVKT